MGKTALLTVLPPAAAGQAAGRLLIAVIDSSGIGEGGSVRFWDMVATATGTPLDSSGERHEAVLQTLRARAQRLLLVVHKIDELINQGWASETNFFGPLRIFANAGTPSERAPVSMLTTSRRTLSELHDDVQKRLGKLRSSPPLNFMEDFLLDPPTKEEIGIYAQKKVVDLSKSQLAFVYGMAFGHPRLTTGFIQSLLNCLRRVGPRRALAQAAAETLDSHDYVLRQVFLALQPQHAFALLCEVVQGLGGDAATHDLSAPGPAPSATPVERPVPERLCEDFLRKRYGNATVAHVEVDRFDHDLAQRLPNETHTDVHTYVHAMVNALVARGALSAYLTHLADLATTSSERDFRVELLEMAELVNRAKRGVITVPSIQRTRTQYIFGECGTQLAKYGIVRRDEHGTREVIVAHVWKWWLLRQLGNHLHSVEDWLHDARLGKYAGGVPLARLQGLIQEAEPLLRAGSGPAILRDIDADKRRR